MQNIYKIINTINNKIYIGKTIHSIDKRLKKHFYLADKKTNRYLYDAINKYGKENFKIELIETCKYELANEKEIYYIFFFKSNNKLFGYNMTKGGDGGKMQEESIKKMVLKKTGTKMSEETKLKMSKSKAGKKTHLWSEKSKLKLSTSLKKCGHKPPIIYWEKEKHPMYGKSHSEEVKQKLSEFRKGKTWEQLNGKESAKLNKKKMSERFLGSNNVNYIEFNLEEKLEEIINSTNIKNLCKNKYNITYATLLYKFKQKYSCTIAQYKNKNHVKN